MHITDPVADMLTRVRNANNAKHETVDVPASNMKKSIAQILVDEGYIKSFTVEDDGLQGMIHITLKYNAGKEKVITGLRRVSKPGPARLWAPMSCPACSAAWVSPSSLRPKGVMTDKKSLSCMSAAKSWHSSGKEGIEQCLELVECPLPFPPVLP